MKNVRGFTLIEVVIAIAIFAMLGFGCYKVVHGLALARNKLSKNSEELGRFAKALNIINDDFTQLTPRKIIDESGKNLPAFEAQGKYMVEFSRVGVANPLMQKRAKVARVAYQFVKEIDVDSLDYTLDKNALKEILGDGKQGYLIRYRWPVLDRGNNDDPQTQILLTGIKSVELEYLDQDKKWSSDWPPLNSQNNSALLELPYAIKLDIDTLQYGSLERLFQVRKLPTPKS